MTKRELGEFLERLEDKLRDADSKLKAATKRRDYESQLAWAGTVSGYEWSYNILLKKYQKMR